MKRKKIIPLIGVSILVVIACEKFASKETILAQKWQLEKIEIGDVLLDKDQVKGYYLDIQPSGTYEIKGYAVETGKWKIEKDSLALMESKKGRRATYFIEKASSGSLILLDQSEGMVQRIYYTLMK